MRYPSSYPRKYISSKFPRENHRPNIVDVISSYTSLRKSGKEYVGLCPFHTEKTPSFSVNSEKGVFHCFGCGEGGDVIRFIEKAEGLGFKSALEHLGLEDSPPRSRDDQVTGNEAQQIVAWAASVSNLIGEKLREIGQDQRLLQKFTDKDLATWQRGVLQRRWTILVVIDDDLADPISMIELWEHRGLIEDLLAL